MYGIVLFPAWYRFIPLWLRWYLCSAFEILGLLIKVSGVCIPICLACCIAVCASGLDWFCIVVKNCSAKSLYVLFSVALYAVRYACAYNAFSFLALLQKKSSLKGLHVSGGVLEKFSAYSRSNEFGDERCAFHRLSIIILCLYAPLLLVVPSL